MPRKIIFTVELALVTDDLDKAAVAVEAKVKQVGGYVSNAIRTGNCGAVRQATWTVRVPMDRYESFVTGVAKLGELESSSRKANDVSQEYYDFEARLRNKRVDEARLSTSSRMRRAN